MIESYQKLNGTYLCWFLVVTFSVGQLVYGQSLELEQKVFQIARQLRCPVCRAESAADSNATTSIEFRNIIQEQLLAGKNEVEILTFFRERYGDWILLQPPKRGLHLVVWLMPIMVGVIALLSLVVIFRHWLKKSQVLLSSVSFSPVTWVRKCFLNYCL